MTDINVTAIDNDGDNSNPDPEGDNFTSNDLGFFDPSELQNELNLYLKHLNRFESSVSGTGNYSPILRVNGDSTLLGFNTGETIDGTYTAAGLDADDSWTNAIQLKDIPIVYLDLNGDGKLEAYREFRLDINENAQKEVSLEELQIFTSSSQATLTQYRFDDGEVLAFRAADGFNLQFDLDAVGENKLILSDEGAGQGRDDYIFYIPNSSFADSSPDQYVTLFSQFGPTPPDDAGFAEWRVQTSSKITGVKFNDHDGDGVRDAGDEGLEGFTVYVDQNNNNKLDIDEQYVRRQNIWH